MALGLLMVVGLWLRLRGADVRMLDHDEAFSWRVATRPFGAMVEQVAGDTHPLLHFLVIRALVWAGWTSPLALRLPSIVVGVATIWLVYRLSLAAIRFAIPADTAIDGRACWAALAAAAYLAIHPYHIVVSDTGRMYSFATAFAALSTWLLIEALDRRSPSWRLYGGYALTAALMIYTHNIGIFVFAAQLGFAVLECCRPRPSVARLGHLAGAGLLVGLLYAPWLSIFLAQARRVHDGFWIPPLTGEGFAEVLVNIVFGRETIDLTTDLTLATLLTLGMTWATARPGRWHSWMLPSQCIAVWALVVFVSTVGGRPILQERYLILVCPAFAGWFAVACATTPPRTARRILTAALLLPTGFAAAKVAIRPWSPPASTYEVISYLRRVGRPGDVLLVNRPGTVNTMRYYQSQIPGVHLDVRYVLEENELRRIGQASHLSSLSADEYVGLDELDRFGASRLWVLNGACDLRGSSWSRQSDITFGDDRGEFAKALQLISFTRPGVATSGQIRDSSGESNGG